MSWLTNIKEFFKPDPDDPRVQGGVGTEFSDEEERVEEEAKAREEAAAARQAARDAAAEQQENQTLRFDDFDGAAAGLGIPEQTPLANEPELDAQGEPVGQDSDELGSTSSPDVKVSPKNPGPADKGATQSTDSSGETVNQESNIEAGNVPLANPLSVFASHSAIISLFVLTKEELRDPDSYRKNEPEFLIARTGGLGADADNITPTIFEENLGIKVEYFLDDLEVESILAQTANSRQTNATLIRFTLKEPYSMGMFLKALQFTVSRADPQRTSYIDPPYLLKIDFKGFDDQGQYVGIPGTSRFIPIKLNRIEFNVSAGGSEYQIEAIAWNDQAYADEIQTIAENLSLFGSNIREFLTTGLEDSEKQGLSSFLEKRELDLTKPNDDDQEPFKEKPDKFVISFPDSNSNRQSVTRTQNDQGATDQLDSQPLTVSSGSRVDDILEKLEQLQNKIATSQIVINKDSAGTRSDGDLVDDEDTIFIDFRNVRVRNDGRLLQFPAGMRIQDIIEEIVLLSEYAKDLAEKEADSLGYKDWFRIETRVYEQSTEPDKITGKTPKVYVYSIVPYKVESHRFLGPDQSLGNRSIDELKRLAPKKYEYIYSGQNDDIINFDLQFNTAFFQGLQQDLGQNSQRNQEQGRSDLGLDPGLLALVRSIGDSEEQERTNGPRPTVQRERGTGISTGSGSAGTGDTDERTAIARNFNEIIVNGLDLITLDIEIWGDPFYIADSGLGNYNAAGTGNPYVTSDNTLDYQYFEPICLLEFKTPVDYNQDGQMDFPENQAEPVAEFSGVYRIITVRNRIASNRFTQELQMVRLRNQELQEKTDNTAPGFTVTNPGAPGGDAGIRN